MKVTGGKYANSIVNKIYKIRLISDIERRTNLLRDLTQLKRLILLFF